MIQLEGETAMAEQTHETPTEDVPQPPVAAKPRTVVEYKGQITAALLRDRMSAIRDVIAPGATDSHLAVFCNICVMEQLNPFTEEIYWSPELKKVMISRDGYLKLVKRTGRYRGMKTYVVYETDDFEMTVVDGKEHVKHRPSVTEIGPILGAYSYLWMEGYESPLFAYAPFASCVRPSAFWKNFPWQAIRKCSERLVLRMAHGDPQEHEPEVVDMSVEQLDGQVNAYLASNEAYQSSEREERREAIHDRITGTTQRDEKTDLIAAIENVEHLLGEAHFDGWDVKPRRIGSRKKYAKTTTLTDASVSNLQAYYHHLCEKYGEMNRAVSPPTGEAVDAEIPNRGPEDTLFVEEPNADEA